MLVIVVLSISGIALTILYYYLTWNFDYWKRRGVLGPEPLPFVGSFLKSAVFWRNFVYDQNEIYRYVSFLQYFCDPMEANVQQLCMIEITVTRRRLLAFIRIGRPN